MLKGMQKMEDALVFAPSCSTSLPVSCRSGARRCCARVASTACAPSCRRNKRAFAEQASIMLWRHPKTFEATVSCAP